MAIAIDGHVHIYPAFPMEEFFDAAFANFAEVLQRHGLSPKSDAVIFLTEGGEHDVFSTLREQAVLPDDTSPEGLRFLKTEEKDSLVAEKNGRTVYIISGRQHVSTENIELLSLFSSERIPDRSLPLADLAEQVRRCGGMVVVPWGVGKWLGKRGALVTELIDASSGSTLFLGDNGNRPLFWPAPAQFGRARKKGIHLLSGSDPLPLASHCRRVATSGSLLMEAEVSRELPAASLRKILERGEKGKEFGGRFPPCHFFYDQIRLKM